jgi:hypothetical protein
MVPLARLGSNDQDRTFSAMSARPSFARAGGLR